MPQVYDGGRPSKKTRKGLPIKKAVKVLKTIDRADAKMAKRTIKPSKRRAVRALKKAR